MAACAFCVHFAVVAILLSSSPRVLSAGDVVNIAASATCTASIDCQPKDDQCTSCENAIDGNIYSTSWHYVGAAVGVWLQIVFDKTYDVSSLLIAQTYWADQRHFKDIKLTFSDGSEHMVTLANRTDGYVVETFAITPPRSSSSIKLSVVSAYDVSSKTHILNEVEVYGSSPDESTSVKIQTTATTTRVQSSPTKMTTTSPTTTTTSPTTTTTPPTTTTTHSTTSTTALTSATTLPTSTTTPPTTTTTPPTTSTTITDTPPSAFVTTAENNVTTDTDPPRSNNLWTGRYLYIAIGVVAALLIIVVCVVVSSRRGKSSKNIEEEVYDTIA